MTEIIFQGVFLGMLQRKLLFPSDEFLQYERNEMRA